MAEKEFDVEVLRPEVKIDEIKHRGEGCSKEDLKKIKEALLAFHNLENMATNIYKYQITKEKSEMNRQLIAAMLNEMTHIQDFEVKLFEYGFKPSLLRYAYKFLGFCFGTFSRLQGEKAILKMGVWVESKAVSHYAELLETVPWDDETRTMIRKDQIDEDEHIERWSSMLKSLN